jgi:hypothetical protein
MTATMSSVLSLSPPPLSDDVAVSFLSDILLVEADPPTSEDVSGSGFDSRRSIICT